MWARDQAAIVEMTREESGRGTTVEERQGRVGRWAGKVEDKRTRGRENTEVEEDG